MSVTWYRSPLYFNVSKLTFVKLYLKEMNIYIKLSKW